MGTVTKHNKKALVTGCNSGIGLGLVKELLNRGFQVAVCCRKSSYISFFHAELNDCQDSFQVFAFDLDSDFLPALEQIKKDFGTPDLLINCAGIMPACNDEAEEQCLKAFRINTIAPMKICRFFLDDMKESNAGCIINVSSKMGSLSDNRSGGYAAYRMSKAALNMATVNLARELDGSGVKVFASHPGWIQTRMGGMDAPDKVEEAVERILMAIEPDMEQFHGTFLCGREVIPW
jgi:NAD(P)-dependent dehydrogenase (short-subunit alcohol dehydrogenase family)